MQCKFCGHALTLEVKPDTSYYERSANCTADGKPDPRFIGETYAYICQHCGKTGRAIHRDNYPDMTGYTRTPETAKQLALFFYENVPG